jgi:ribosomal silencing factor RsfS
MRSKEKVQEAIIERLQAHSGLDLKTLDVTTTSVTFDKKMAYATVAFHPKSDPTVNGGMTMRYTLEERGGKWVVVNVGDSQGHGMQAHAMTGGSDSRAADQLPPGHPSVEGMPNGRRQ